MNNSVASNTENIDIHYSQERNKIRLSDLGNFQNKKIHITPKRAMAPKSRIRKQPKALFPGTIILDVPFDPFGIEHAAVDFDNKDSDPIENVNIEVREHTILKDFYNAGENSPKINIGASGRTPMFIDLATEDVKGIFKKKQPRQKRTILQLGYRASGNLESLQDIFVYKPAHIIFFGKDYGASEDNIIEVDSIKNPSNQDLFIEFKSNAFFSARDITTEEDKAKGFSEAIYDDIKASRFIVSNGAKVETNANFFLKKQLELKDKSKLILNKDKSGEIAQYINAPGGIIAKDSSIEASQNIEILTPKILLSNLKLGPEQASIKSKEVKIKKIYLNSSDQKEAQLKIDSKKLKADIITNIPGKGILQLTNKLNLEFSGNLGSEKSPISSLRLASGKFTVRDGASIWGDIDSGDFEHKGEIEIGSGSNIYGKIGSKNNPLKRVKFTNATGKKDSMPIYNDIFANNIESFKGSVLDFKKPVEIKGAMSLENSSLNLNGNKITKTDGDIVFSGDTKISVGISASGEMGSFMPDRASILDFRNSKLEIMFDGSERKDETNYTLFNEDKIFLPQKITFKDTSQTPEDKIVNVYDLESRSIITRRKSSLLRLEIGKDGVIGKDSLGEKFDQILEARKIFKQELSKQKEEKQAESKKENSNQESSQLNNQTSNEEDNTPLTALSQNSSPAIQENANNNNIEKTSGKFGEDTVANPRVLMGVEKMIQTVGALSNKVSSRMLDFESQDTPIYAVGAGAGDKQAPFEKGFWTSAFIGKSKKKLQAEIDGYNATNKGFTLGFDREFNDRLTLGVAFGIIKSNFKYTDSREGDESSTRTKLFSVYGSYKLPKNSFIQTMLSYGDIDVAYADTRISNNQENIAYGNFKSKSFAGQALFGRNYKICNDKFRFTPLVGIKISHFREAAYSEYGSGNLYDVAARTITRPESMIGLRTSMHFRKKSVEIIPEFDVIVHHDFNNRAPKIDAKLLSSNISAAIKKEEINKTSLNLGAGVILKSTRFECKLEYDAYLSKKYVGHQAAVKFRVNF